MPSTLTEKLKALYKAQDTLPKLIEDASVPTQRMDDYYVKLQIVLDDKKAGIVSPSVDIAKIFDPFGDQGSVEKVLIVGGAGVGKTTLLNHITYEWSRNNIFVGKFDYVIKIRLKNLLNKYLCNEIADLEDIEDQLPLLIQRSLEQQQLEQKNSNTLKRSNSLGIQDETIFDIITLSEIKGVDKAKTLLVLDGYDEIEHLDRGGHIAREIMNNIFDFPNVLITSRPNSISSNMESRFERKIENVGIGQDGARSYIENYFKMQSKALIEEVDEFIKVNPTKKTMFSLLNFLDSQGSARSKELEIYFNSIDNATGGNRNLESFKQSISKYHSILTSLLLDLLERNLPLRELLTIPMNSAMICLISSDSEIMNTFTEDFKLGELYNGVVVWLGKRYLHKFASSESKNIHAEMVLDRAEISVLRSIAHDKFKINEIFIPGKEIHRAALAKEKTIGISAINKIGLLKADNNFFAYELKLLNSVIDEADVQAGKIYLYLSHGSSENGETKENVLVTAQLTCILQGRNGIEKFVISDELSSSSKEPIKNGLSKSLFNIKKFLIARKQHLDEVDEAVLAEYIANKSGYIVQRSVSAKAMVEEIEANDLIHRKHAFIHLSFQEYLTAYNLKILLQSTEQEHYVQAAQFIGEHRNEPRYLLTLKFLSGLVTQSDDILLIQRFWEAVTCNVDGVIELGLNTKVNLLMHLLAQSKLGYGEALPKERAGAASEAKTNFEIDPRIPNIQKIQDLIDIVVTSDIAQFADQIIASGYTSPKIKEGILAIMQFNYNWKIEYAKDLIEQGSTFSSLTQNILAKSEINLDSISEEEKVKIATMRRIELQATIKLVSKLIANNKFSREELGYKENEAEVMDQPLQYLFIKKLLNIMKIPSWQTKLVVINAITDLLSNKIDIFKLDTSLIKGILENVQWHITDDNLKIEVLNLLSLLDRKLGLGIETLEARALIKTTIFNQIEILNGSKEITDISDALPSLPNFINQDLANEIMPQLQHGNWVQIYIAIRLIMQLSEQNPDLLNARIIENLYLKLSNKSSLVSSAAAEVLGAIAFRKPELITASMVETLVQKLSDSSCSVKEAAATAVGVIASTKPELMTASMVESIVKNLSNIFFCHPSPAVVTAVVGIVSKKPELITDSMVERIVLNLSNSNRSVSSAAAQTLVAITSEKPELITDSIVDSIVQKLSDSHSNVNSAAAKALSGIAFTKPELINIENLVQKLSDSNWRVSSAAAKVLSDIVSTKPELINIENLVQKLSDSNSNVSSAAAKALSDIASTKPELINIENLVQKLSDSNSNVSSAAAKALSDVASTKPEFITASIVEILIQKLSDSNSNVSSAAKALSDIASTKSELITSSMVEILVQQLSDSEHQVREAATKAVGAITSRKPELITSSMVKILVQQFSRFGSVSSVAEEALRLIAIKPELITSEIAGSLYQKLSDFKPSVRSAAAGVLDIIASTKPELLNMESLVQKLSDRYSDVSYAAAIAVGRIASIKPELLNMESLINNCDSSPSVSVRSSAATAVGIIASIKPELITVSMVEILVQKLSDRYSDVSYAAAIAVGRIASIKPELLNMESLINRLSDSDSNVRSAAARAVGMIASTKPELITASMVESLSNKLSDRDSYVNSAAATAVVGIASTKSELITASMIKILSNKLSDRDSDISPAAVTAVGVIASTKPELITASIVESIVQKLSDSDSNVRSAAARAVGMIASTKPELITSFMVEILSKKLSDGDSNVKPAAAIVIGKIASIKPELITSSIVEILSKKLSDGNWHVREAAATAVGIIASIKPELITSSIVEILSKKLSDSDSDVREAAVTAVGIIASIKPELIIASMVESLINKLSDSDLNVISAAASALDRIASTNPELINMESLIHKLRDDDHDGCLAVGNAIALIASEKPELINMESIFQKFSVSDPDGCQAAAKALGAIASTNPELINIESLSKNLSNSDSSVSFSAAMTAVVIASIKPELITASVVESLSDKLSDSEELVSISAAEALGAIASRKPELITDLMVENLINKLSDSNSDVRSAAATVIGRVASIKPELITDSMVESLSNKLSDSDSNVRSAAVSAVLGIASKKPELVTASMVESLVEKLNDSDSNVRSAAVTAVLEIASEKPELITASMVESLVKKLNDSDSGVRSAVATAVGKISSTKPELILAGMLESLINKLSDRDFDIRSAAVIAVIGIASEKPELITEYMVEGLFQTLVDSDSSVRSAAATVIGIASIKPELITEYIIESIVQKLSYSDYDIRSAAAKALGAIASIKPELITASIVRSLFQTLVDRFSDVRSAATTAFGIIASIKPELITFQISESLGQKLSDNDSGIRSAAVTAVIGIASAKPELITVSMVESLRDKLSDRDSDVRSAAVTAVVRIASIKAELIIACMVESLSNKLSDSVDYVRSAAATVIGQIATTKPELITEYMVESLVQKLSDSERQVRQAAATAVSSIASTKPELLNMDSLVQKLSDSYDSVRSAAAEALGAIASTKPELLNMKILIQKLIDSPPDVKEIIAKILFIKMSLLSEEAIKLLDHSSPSIREFAKQIFMAILSNDAESARAKPQALLGIIAFYDPNDREKKHLIELAKKVLDQKVSEFKDEDVFELTQNYDELLSLSSESPMFLRKVYAQVLSDGVITVVEKDFMIKSIERGVATSFTREGKVIFEGKTYEVNEESKPYLNEIIKAALGQKDDILVKQYNEYQPIFENHQTGMRIATNDVAVVKSVVNSLNELNNYQWQVSVLHLSDHHQSNLKNKFILLERRDEFATLELHKILLAADGIIKIEHYIKLPSEIDRSFREEIFGLMSYVDAKPRYFATIFEHVDLKKGDELLEFAVANKDKVVDASKSASLLRIISDNIISYGLLSYWKTYLVNQNTIELKKYDLLGYQLASDKVMVRQDSIRIEEYDRVHHLEVRVDSIEDKISKLNIGALESIIAKEQFSQKEQAEITIIESDPYKFALYRAIIWQLNAVYAAIQVIDSGMVSASKEHTQGTIGSVGKVLQWASSHIPIVGMGVNILGQGLEGADQAIQEEILTKRMANVKTIARDSSQMNELSEYIARKITLSNIKISSIRDESSYLDSTQDVMIDEIKTTAQSLLGIDIGASLMSTAANAASNAIAGMKDNAENLIQSGMVGIVKNCVLNVRSRYQYIKQQSEAGDVPKDMLDYFERFMQGPQNQDTPEKRGETAAKEIADLIIKDIYSGNYKNYADKTKIAQLILESVEQTYETTEKAISNNNAEQSDIRQKNSQPVDNKLSEKSFTTKYSERIADCDSRLCSPSKPLYVNIEKKHISDGAFRLLVQANTGSTISSLTMEQFKAKTFSFEMSIDIIKEMADVYLDRGNHNVITGRKMISKFSFFSSQINLTKELKAGAPLVPEQVSGEVIISTLIRCGLEDRIDPSRINDIFETEENFRFAKPFSSDRDDSHNQEVRFISDVVYNNPLLSQHNLIQQVISKYGTGRVNDLINLGTDQEIAQMIIESIEQSNAEHVLSILFDKIHKIDSGEQANLLTITSETHQQSHSHHYTKPDNSFTGDNKHALTAYTAKEAIEALPTLKYFVKEILHINYELPKFIDNNYFKLTAHFVAINIGAYSLIGKLSIVSSLLPTAVYGGKVLAYEYLSQQKQLNFQFQDDKSIDSLLEFTQKCGFDMAAQTALGIVSSFISGSPAIYDIMISATIGGMQCYSQYNQRDMYSSNIQPIGEKVIPYIADTMTYYVAINNMQFDLSSTAGQMLAIKQGFTVLSSVVMSDYITKLALTSVPEGYSEYLDQTITDLYNYCFGLINSDSDYFKSEL